MIAPQRYVVTGDIAAHMAALKPGNWHRTAEVQLDVPLLTMRDVPADGNHCVITGVASLINYYRAEGEVLPVTTRDDAIAFAVRAAHANGYSNRLGIMPWRIARVARTALNFAGAYRARARNRYLWTVHRTLIPELTAGRPFLMNIARGSYARHTVLVTGFELFRADDGAGTAQRTMLTVHDGWSPEPRRFDYTAFMRDLRSGVIASVTTVTPW